MLAGIPTEYLVSGIILLIVFEALALHVLAVFGYGPGIKRMIAGLLAGAFLLLALRASLTGDKAQIVAWLACAFMAHGAELLVRWRESSGGA